MSTNLIPCPDCGASAELKHGSYPDMERSYSYVHCTNPDCHLYRHTLHFTASTTLQSDVSAMQSWNERYADMCPVAEINARKMPSRSHAGNLPLTRSHA